MAFESAVVTVIMAVAYSFTVYFGKKTKPDGGEQFNARKFVRTLLVGVGVGVVAVVLQIDLSLSNFGHIAATYGIVGAADHAVKILFRNVDIDEWLNYGSS